jgi:5-methylcytosine-specific restriction endonuclease McrA
MKTISRSDAKAAGLKHYFTGKPCKHGHVAERQTLGGSCMECRKIRYEANADEIRKRSRDWHRANSAKAHDYHQKWLRANPEKVRKQLNSWKKANPDRIREIQRSWKKNNPDKVKADKSNYHARRRGAEGFHTAADKVNIRAKQKDRCAYCRVKLNGGGHLDHIQPLSPRFTGKLGTNWPSNLQWLCEDCNSQKIDKDPIEFAKSQGFLL